MNVLVKHRIEVFIKKYKARSFDQDDVMLFLIDIRDTSKFNSLAREMGDYFAHPHERDRGITWEMLEEQYKSATESFDEIVSGKNTATPKTLCTELEILESVAESLQKTGIETDIFDRGMYVKSARDFMLCLVGLLTSFNIKVGGVLTPLKLCLSNRGPFLSIMSNINVVKDDRTLTISWPILETSCRVQDECMKELFPWGGLENFVARRSDGGELAMCRLETDKEFT